MSGDQWGLIVGAVVLIAGALLVRYVMRAAVRGTLGPNHVAGMRTSATLSSPEAWLAGHQAAAGWTDRAAVVCAACAAAAILVVVAGAGLGWGTGLLLAGAGALLVGAIGGGVVANRAAAAVRDARRV